MRTRVEILSDLIWSGSRMSDAQEHSIITKYEERIERLQAELKEVDQAATLPTNAEQGSE